MTSNISKALRRIHRAHKSLDLSLLELSILPNDLFELSALEDLNLGGNLLTELPKEIYELDKLNHLAVWVNHLSEIPPQISQMKALQRLELSHNQIKYIPEALVSLPNLEFLGLYGNPIENIPLELLGEGVEDNCLPALRDYFAYAKHEKLVVHFEAKLFLVGESQSGKSSIAQRLCEMEVNLSKGDHTDPGLDIMKLKLAHQNRDKAEILLNLWDFAGKETHFAINQFFFAKRSLYLLVYDGHHSLQDAHMEYWLNIIHLLNDHSPILIIQNKADEGIVPVDKAYYEEKYPTIAGFIQTVATSDEGVAELVEHIHKQVVRLPHVRNEIPKVWLNIRQQLSALTSRFISYQQYVSLCHQNGLNAEQANFLLLYLDRLGAVFHFREDSFLQKTIFLKPGSLINTIYKLIDSPMIEVSNGQVAFGEMQQIWQEFGTGEKHEELVRIMELFELCFYDTKAQKYVFPQFLSDNQSKIEWDEEHSFHFTVNYAFRPAGIFSRLIVRLHSYATHLWKNGILIKKLKAKALITNDLEQNLIAVSIKGIGINKLRSLIRYHLEEIHSTLNHPKKEVHY